MAASRREVLQLILSFVGVSAGIFLLNPFLPLKAARILFVGLWVLLPLHILLSHHPKIRNHVTRFAVVFGLVTGLFMEMIAERGLAWHYETALPFAHINTLPLEALGWYVLWFGVTAALYRVFFDRDRHSTKPINFIRDHRTLLVCLFVIVMSAIAIAFFWTPSSPDFLTYLILLGPCFVAPTVYALILHPHLFLPMVKTSASLLVFAVAFEIVGLTVGWWTYPGSYLFALPIGNAAILPLEEIVFWLIAGPFFVIALYEEFERKFR